MTLTVALALGVSVVASKRGWLGFLHEKKEVRFGNLPVPKWPVKVDSLPTEGFRSAPVAVIVFSDFECPACAAFASQTLPVVRDQYVVTGRAMIAFHHFPIERIHPLAVQAAAIAECAGRNGQFWTFHDRLFSRKGALTPEYLEDTVQGLGRPAGELQRCVAEGGEDIVRKQLEEARRLQVASTPTYFVGANTREGVVVRERGSGAATQKLTAMIDAALGTVTTR